MKETVCVGYVKDFFELSGVRVEYLHMESVDGITIYSRANPGTVLHCIYEVFNLWCYLGSMP